MIPAASALTLSAWVLALGQVPTASVSEAQARESALFGEPEVSDRESALFGEPEASDRESALFGEPEASTGTVAAKGPDRAAFERSADKVADRPSTEDRLFDALRGKNDYLDIGGVVWLWFQMVDIEDTDFGASRFSSPNFVDVYMDARPNDRIRAYLRGRLNYDPSIDTSALTLTGQTASRTRVRLDQLWLKFDVLRTAFVTVGQQRVRWGTGRIWNPTDFMNPSRRDALDFLDVRLGVPLVKLHLPIESLGWNFYALASLDGASTLKKVGGALRAEALLGPAEVTLSAALQKDQPVRLGADLSLPVWEFDLRVEAALLHDVRRPFFDQRTDWRVLNTVGVVDDDMELLGTAFGSNAIDRSDDWIPQLVVGLDYAVRYNDEDTLLFALEYFFNDAGASDSGQYLALLLNGGFEGLYLGRHYISAAAYLVGPGDWNDSTFSLVGLANLSDRTGLVRFNYSVQILTFLRVNAFVSRAMGPSGGEFQFAFRVPAVEPSLAEAAMIPEAFASGVRLRANLWQLGGTLVLDF